MSIWRIATVASGLVLFFGLHILPANATGTIECRGVDQPDVTAFLLVGRLPVLNVLRAEISASGQVWSTEEPVSSANSILFGQGIDTQDALHVDFTDTDVNEIIVSLRTVSGTSGKAFAEAGILSISDVGIWAVTCDNG